MVASQRVEDVCQPGLDVVGQVQQEATVDDVPRCEAGPVARPVPEFRRPGRCRNDRGDPVVQLAPPLICEEEHFAEMEQILRTVLTEAWNYTSM